MKNNNESNKMSVSEQLKLGEMLGAKVATILNKARAKTNKLLAPLGYGVNFQADFYKLDNKSVEEPKSEVLSG